MDTTPNTREIREKPLVRQDGDSVDLALYLDPELLRGLDANDPTESLHGENLHDCWMALEGISHFLYLTWNAHHERSVTLLEIELQAEVDKYVLAAFLFGRQLRGLAPKALYRHLFKYADFDERLDGAERHRYRSANYFASRFCSYIDHQFHLTRTPGLVKPRLKRAIESQDDVPGQGGTLRIELRRRPHFARSKYMS